MMIIAHRGGHALGPENTISTMKKAVDAGAQALHIDIRCNMEDVPYLMHDATVDRTTDGSGEIFKMTNAGVTTVKIEGGLSIPPLSVVLDTFRSEKVVLFCELKHPATAMPVAEIVRHFITKKNIPNHRIVIITQYHQLIAMIKDKYPKLITGAMVKTIPESLAACGSYTNSHYILPPIDAANEAFMEDAKARELQVIPWTVENSVQMQRAKQLGAAGIITPDPKLG